VDSWHLHTLPPSSDKLHDREPGPDAPREPTRGRSKPRVLFSSDECRAVVLDIAAGEDLDEHSVRERALIQVLSGRVSITGPSGTLDCPAGTLVNLEPEEEHALRGLEDARLLLILAPWPAAGRAVEAHHLPRNARVEPDRDRLDV